MKVKANLVGEGCAGGAMIYVCLSPEEIEQLKEIVMREGAGAGAANPCSPLRNAMFLACRQFFPSVPVMGTVVYYPGGGTVVSPDVRASVRPGYIPR